MIHFVFCFSNIHQFNFFFFLVQLVMLIFFVMFYFQHVVIIISTKFDGVCKFIEQYSVHVYFRRIGPKFCAIVVRFFCSLQLFFHTNIWRVFASFTFIMFINSLFFFLLIHISKHYWMSLNYQKSTEIEQIKMIQTSDLYTWQDWIFKWLERK